MTAAPAPVLVAYDGSAAARRAISETAELFASRPVLVTTIWEPALAYSSVATPIPDAGLQAVPMDMAEAQKLEGDLEARAQRVAEDGAELARSAGLQAEAFAVAGDARAADAIVEAARNRSVAAIVIGSRGLSGLRARLEGSTSSGVVKGAPCPVVVVHDD
jgi:nucleotide-binding universal stress UspA family protein